MEIHSSNTEFLGELKDFETQKSDILEDIQKYIDQVISDKQLLEGRILSFRANLSDKGYENIVKEYDEHFNISVDRHGKL